MENPWVLLSAPHNGQEVAGGQNAVQVVGLTGEAAGYHDRYDMQAVQFH
jgi:hypothetical protein